MEYLDQRVSPMPLVPVAVCVIAGIVAAQFFDSLWCAALFTAAGMILCAFRRYLWCSWAIAATLGAVAYLIAMPGNQTTVDSVKRFYKAEVKSVTDNGNSVSAVIEIVAAGAAKDNLSDCRHVAARLTAPALPDSVRPGFTIVFIGGFEPIRVHTDLPDEIDPGALLLRKGILFRTFVEPAAIVTVERTPGVLARMVRLRDKFIDAIYMSRLSPDAKVFIAVALLGETNELPASARQRFSDAGLGHILALSGLHSGIIALLISIALWPLHAAGKEQAVSVITIILLWGYVALTGMSPSVTRAVIMATIYLLGRAIQRRTSPFNSLAGAAIVILLFDPLALFSVGFQLSFCAVAAIIMFAERLNPINPRRRMAYRLMSYVSVCLSAIIGTSVLSMIYFHNFPLYFIGANLIASLLLPFLIGGALLLIFLVMFGCDPQWLCLIIDLLYIAVDRIADFFATLPGAVVRNIYLPGWIDAVYCASVAAFYLWLKKTDRLRTAVFASLLVITCGLGLFAPEPVRKPQLYLSRNSYHTDLAIDNNTSTLHIITTAPHEQADIRYRAGFRYRDYMGRRGIDSVNVVVTEDFSAPGIEKRGQLLYFGRRKIAIVNGPAKQVPLIRDAATIDYAIVCRGYRGDIPAILANLRPDTIVLGSDLHPRRREKYLRECDSLGAGTVNARNKGWSLTP